MATKESKSNVCTVTLSETEITVVTLPDKYSSFNIRNDSSGIVNISVSDPDVTANGDDVYSIPAGQSICTAPVTATTTLYVGTGSGSVIIAGINSAKNRPFENSGSGGGGSSYILPSAGVNTLGGIQAKAKTIENAECAVGANNKMYAPVPVKLSDLNNDAGFIDNTVDNLINYYTKSSTYNKSEIDTLISSLNSLSVLIATELPTADISLTTIYLVQIPETTTYTQWMYISGAWANLGSTAINLENYYTKAEINTLLDGKVDKVTGMGLSSNDFTTALKDKLDGIAESANVNVIEGIKVNGTAQTPTNKAIDLAIPEIDDTSTTSTTETWSAKKISDKIAEVSGGGEANVIESISVNGEAIEPDGNKNVDITIETIQLTTMPTASVAELGKIYQFVGATTAEFTNGYFYECTVADTVYSWTRKDIQPASGGGSGELEQHGKVSIVVADNGIFSVTFPIAYESAPTVVVTALVPSSSAYMASLTALSATGFAGKTTNTSGGFANTVINWRAIGTPAT